MSFDYSTFNNFPKDKKTLEEAKEFDERLAIPYKKYGIENPYDRVYSKGLINSGYTDYEIEAIKYIQSKKKLPKELEQLLLDTKEDRVKKRKEREAANKKRMPSKEEIEAMLRDKNG